MSHRWLNSVIILLLLLMILLIGCTAISNPANKYGVLRRSTPTRQIENFNGQRALDDVIFQVESGPRIPGSAAHGEIINWISNRLQSSGWQSSIQEKEYQGIPIRNVVGTYGEGRPWVVLGAHYDTRLIADMDPNPAFQITPVPGANDGGSGVSVLLELARIIPGHISSDAGQIWLVFFDAEDNGRINGWEWIMGSRLFVQDLDEYPDAAVILDMVGDKELNIYKELNSDPILTEDIWRHAEKLGYGSEFISEGKHKILDDHIPFIEVGIPAVDVIDYDYPYWHTLGDSIDKVSARSLRVVGETILTWLKFYMSQ